jgi:hypothetical protein
VTGFESFVLLLNRWLASAIPAYDPVMTMLVLVIVVIGALTWEGSAQGVGAPRKRRLVAAAGDPYSHPAPRAQRAVFAASGDSRSDKSLTATPSNRVSEESRLLQDSRGSRHSRQAD